MDAGFGRGAEEWGTTGTKGEGFALGPAGGRVEGWLMKANGGRAGWRCRVMPHPTGGARGSERQDHSDGSVSLGGARARLHVRWRWPAGGRPGGRHWTGVLGRRARLHLARIPPRGRRRPRAGCARLSRSAFPSGGRWATRPRGVGAAWALESPERGRSGPGGSCARRSGAASPPRGPPRAGCLWSVAHRARRGEATAATSALRTPRGPPRHPPAVSSPQPSRHALEAGPAAGPPPPGGHTLASAPGRRGRR